MFLVVGPESSGNHITEGLLARMGCWGSENAGRVVIFDFLRGNRNIAFPKDVPIVFMRSIPNRDVYPGPNFDPQMIKSSFESIGYNVKTIIPVRSWSATIKSNYREKTVEASAEVLEESWRWLGLQLPACHPFFFFCTSFLFKYPEIAIKELETITGLMWQDCYDLDFIKDPDKARHKELMNRGIDVEDVIDLDRRARYGRNRWG